MKSPFTFDPARQQFRLKAGQDGAGRFVTKDAVRKIVDDDIAAQKERLATINARLKTMAQKLSDGDLTGDEFKGEVALWKRRKRQIVAAANLNYSAAGRGGIEQMDSAAYGRAGVAIKSNYAALDGFVADILANPKLVLESVPGKMDFDKRSEMYVDTALFSFNREQSLSHSENGFTRYWNVPHSQESCQSSTKLPGCDEITAAGKQKIGTLPRHGERSCGPKCKCGWAYDRGPLDGIIPFEFEAKAFVSHAVGL